MWLRSIGRPRGTQTFGKSNFKWKVVWIHILKLIIYWQGLSGFGWPEAQLFVYIPPFLSPWFWKLRCSNVIFTQIVNYLLRGWIRNLDSQGSVELPLLETPESVQYSISRDLEFFREGSKRSVKVRVFGSRFSLWNAISSYIKSRFEDLRINSK